MRLLHTKNRIFYIFGGCVAVYAALTLSTPLNPATLHHYHLTAMTMHWLNISFVVPLAIIWFIACYGYVRLRRYSQLVAEGGGKDSKPVKQLASGVLILTIWLPLSSIIGALYQYIIATHPGLEGPGLVIHHYFDLLLPLIGFTLIGLAAHRLNSLTRQKFPWWAVNVLTIILLIINAIYSYLILHNSSPVVYSIYYLPKSLVLFSLVIPYTYIWIIGLIAAGELYQYRMDIPGVLYRRSWGWLAAGIALLIVMSILLQYITTLSQQLLGWSLGGILGVVYIILLLMAGSYLVLASGAKKLQKIEEA